MKPTVYFVASLVILSLLSVLILQTSYSHIAGVVRPHDLAAIDHDNGSHGPPLCNLGNGNSGQPGKMHYVDSDGDHKHKHLADQVTPAPSEPLVCLTQ